VKTNASEHFIRIDDLQEGAAAQGAAAMMNYSGRNCMPGFTKTFVALGDTTTVRLGFCFLLMTDFPLPRLIRCVTRE
jgi:hypothetical protein